MEKEAECTVVAFDSQLGSVSAAAEYVCVGEGGVAFSAGERGPVFTTASIHVVPPHDFKYVSSRPVWCV